MTDLDARCLDAFPEWLKTLGDDALALDASLQDPSLPQAARRRVAGALNYLFKSLDLIPDGIENLGFIDDAFVFRVAAATALADGAGQDSAGTLKRLSDDAELVREFMGDDFPRLEQFARGLEQTNARGRTVDDIISDDSIRAAFSSDVKGWANSYQAPAFGRDDKNLVKLRSFLNAKLPS